YCVRYFFFSSRRRHTRFSRDWSSDVCSSDLEAAANRDRPSEIQPFLRKHFEQIAMAKVATSALMAQEMGYLPPEAVIVMNDARQIGRASCREREEVGVVGGV